MFMKTVGIDELRINMKGLSDRLKKRARRSLLAVAGDILADAKSNYVPEDKGELRSSGRIVVDEEKDTMVVGISFGEGKSAPYAVAVHEHLSVHSPYSWKVAEGKTGRDPRTGRFQRRGVHFTKGGPKYLEKPLLAATGGGRLEKRLVEDLTDELQKRA